jgi:hypothetical protein
VKVKDVLAVQDCSAVVAGGTLAPPQPHGKPVHELPLGDGIHLTLVAANMASASDFPTISNDRDGRRAICRPSAFAEPNAALTNFP